MYLCYVYIYAYKLLYECFYCCCCCRWIFYNLDGYNIVWWFQEREINNKMYTPKKYNQINKFTITCTIIQTGGYYNNNKIIMLNIWYIQMCKRNGNLNKNNIIWSQITVCILNNLKFSQNDVHNISQMLFLIYVCLFRFIC